MELRNDDALSTIDDERTLVGHVRDRTEEHVIDGRVEILVIRVSAIKLKFGFERYAVSETTRQTLLDRVSRRIDIIVKKLQHEVVAGVCDREILCKHLVQSLVLALFGRRVELKKIPERFQLNLEEVRKRKRVLDRREIHTRLFG